LWSAVAILGAASGLAGIAHAQDRDRHDEHGHDAGHGRDEGHGGRDWHGEHQPFQRDGRGFVLDNRYEHGHYYPAPGTVIRTLPDGYRAYSWHDGRRYYFSGGAWYAPGPAGFVVARPPIGLTVSVLPPFYSTLWFGGVPYYYADDVYYGWRPDLNGYAVVDPPPGADAPEAVPPGAPPAAADDFYVYPRNGQSQTQQAADRYECHSWSKGQTGYDPTQPDGAVGPTENAERREQYRRAITACLEARGYSVK